MPVSINLEQELVTWLDVGSYHFYEGFFRKSIQILSLLQKEMVSFTTDLNILEDDRVTGDHIYPSGFIFHDLIHAAFPDVPAIFLSRNPAEIVSSFRKAPPGWLKDGDDLEEIISGFLARAKSIDPEQLRSIDHLEIIPEKLDLVLDYFKVYPVAAELDLMKSQFDYDSKVEFNRKKFVK